MHLTTAYPRALVYAAELHRGQVRKGTTVPYLSHLLAVSGLVLEAGGDEEQAIAGLLHDALEDQSDRTSHAEIAQRFGHRVADLVLACSHSEFMGQEPADMIGRWWWRRRRYLEHLAEASTEVLVVSRADKLHNCRTTLTDLRTSGPSLWERFTTGREGQSWYYGALAAMFTQRLAGQAQTEEFTRVVKDLQSES